MLDGDEAKLTRIGSVMISDGRRIEVIGFSAKGAGCRDVAALGALWAIGELQRELMKTMRKPGGGNIVVD